MNVALVDNALKEAKGRGEIDCEKIGFREIPVFDDNGRQTGLVHQAWAVRGDRIAYAEMSPELIEMGPPGRVGEALLVDIFCKELAADLEPA